MSDLSNFTENQLATIIAQLPNLHVALFSSSPGEEGTSGVEVTTSVREAGRVPVAFALPPVDGKITNQALVDFGYAPGTVTISHWAIFDAASGGNMVGRCALAAPRNVQKGAPVKFKAGTINLAFG